MKRYRFEAAIQRSTGWGAYLLFPHDTVAEFGIKGRVPVRALLEGVPYAGSLMPSKSGYHRLAAPRTILEVLGKVAGDLIEVVLWRDDAPRTVELPEEFVRLLKAEGLWESMERLSVTRRKEYRNWIASAKREETRRRRMEKAIAMLRRELLDDHP